MKKVQLIGSIFAVVLLFFMAGDSFGTTPGEYTTYTTYDNLSDFEVALGGVTPAIQNFDSYTDNQDLSGVEFLPGFNVTSNISPILVHPKFYAPSNKELFAIGNREDTENRSYYDINFSSSYNAVGFTIEAWDPTIPEPGLMEIFFSDNTSASISLFKTSGSEDDPVFFGIIADTPIVRIRWNEPPEINFIGWEETALDNVMVAVASLAISSIIPNHGIMVNPSLNFTLNGTGFQAEATVELTNFVIINSSGESSIHAATGTISPTQIPGTFDLTRAPIGQYDVVVTNPDGQSAILPKGFAVLDNNPPVTTAFPVGGTYNAPLKVTLKVNEPDTIATIKYSTDGTNFVAYTDPINISSSTTLLFYSEDIAMRTESVNTEIYTIDTGFKGTAELTPRTDMIIPVTSTFTFPVDTTTFVVDCHKVNFTLRDSNGNALPTTDYLKVYVIPDDVITYFANVPVTVTCDLAQLYPPEGLVPGTYTLDVTYSSYFEPKDEDFPPGIQLFKGSISAGQIRVTVAAGKTHIITTSVGTAGGGIFLAGSVVSGPVRVSDGSSPTFAIIPDPGYHVLDVRVNSDCKGGITSYTFNNVTKNHTISATFAKDTFTIKATAGSNGTISPSGPVLVKNGDSMKFTIKPSPGYKVADVRVDGTSLGKVYPSPFDYTFDAVDKNHTISATFAK